jgi:hypothetical protein
MKEGSLSSYFVTNRFEINVPLPARPPKDTKIYNKTIKDILKSLNFLIMIQTICIFFIKTII